MSYAGFVLLMCLFASCTHDSPLTMPDKCSVEVPAELASLWDNADISFSMPEKDKRQCLVSRDIYDAGSKTIVIYVGKESVLNGTWNVVGTTDGCRQIRLLTDEESVLHCQYYLPHGKDK